MSIISLYETLRLDVVKRASSHGHGWVLFIRSGMRSWCDVRHQQTQELETQKDIPPAVPNAAMPFEHTLIQVLAGMVLNLQQEVSCHD